jgi:SAM-dependent methyltransferase
MRRAFASLASRPSLPAVVTEFGWEGAWRQGVTPWRLQYATPTLAKLISDAAFPAPFGAKVLVPGCGCARDAIALADAGFSVDAEDISQAALAEAKVSSEAHSSSQTGRRPGVLSLIERDFFSDATPTAHYAAMWDHTFLCAIPVEMRQAWARAAARRLAPGGALVSLLFPVDSSLVGGPPFHTDPQSIDALLLRAGFTRERLEIAPASISARTGREWLGIWRRGDL